MINEKGNNLGEVFYRTRWTKSGGKSQGSEVKGPETLLWEVWYWNTMHKTLIHSIVNQVSQLKLERRGKLYRNFRNKNFGHVSNCNHDYYRTGK